MVSSGAGICGVGAINKWSRRGDMNYKQALCAIGQVELMMAYKEYFADYDIHVGQILLTLSLIHISNPQPEEETRYRQQKRAYEKEKEILRGYIGRATVTADNETKEVFCNIGNVKDAITAAQRCV